MVSNISVVTWYIVRSKASVHHIVLFADQPLAEGGIKDRPSRVIDFLKSAIIF